MRPSASRLAAPALASLVLAASPVLAQTPEEKGLEIAKKVDKANEDWKTESSEMEMTLVNAHGDEVVRKMKSASMEVAGDGDRSLIAFEWPADVKGTRMLTWAHKKDNDDQWLYLPSLKRVKRISARSKTGSFMGSEFSFEDLGGRELEKFTYRFVKEEKLDGRDSWVVENTPTGESGYSKQVAWTDKEYLNATKVEFYDKKGALLKTMTLSGYTKTGSWWRPGKIEVVNHQTKKKSVLSWKGRQLGTALDPKDFDSENLED